MALGFPSPAFLWRFARKIEGVFDDQAKQGSSLADIQVQLASLLDRVTRLEAREEIIVVKAESAARAAAMASATASVADLARRIGGLEERGKLGGNPRISET